VKSQLSELQRFLTLPRETLPRLTAEEAERYLRGAAERLGVELTKSQGVAPAFALFPKAAPPAVTLFQTWHAETLPVAPAALEGAERLALGSAIAGAESAGIPIALVVAPAATAGSQGLDELLREHRARVTAPAAYWVRVAPSLPADSRRRVFLGSRGRVVVAVRGGSGNPYSARDTLLRELRGEAFGPRPLDFELIRKLAQGGGAAGLMGPDASDEASIRAALFDPRGEVVIPAVPHPDRPRAWIVLETAEAMEAEPVARRLNELSDGGQAEIVERFPWDRSNIHHPAIHALIELAKERSAGAEIWPSSPWPTPSGLFSRALGVGLAEWAIPLPQGAAIRFPKPEQFETLAGEVSELLHFASRQAAPRTVDGK